jgi:hypothetical protein
MSLLARLPSSAIPHLLLGGGTTGTTSLRGAHPGRGAGGRPLPAPRCGALRFIFSARSAGAGDGPWRRAFQPAVCSQGAATASSPTQTNPGTNPATGPSPSRQWYSVSAEGLLEASKFAQDFAGNLAGTLGELGKLLWPDFELPGGGGE